MPGRTQVLGSTLEVYLVMETAAGAWVGAILGSLAVGLTGLAPLLFIPTQAAISTTQVKDFYKKYKSFIKKTCHVCAS